MAFALAALFAAGGFLTGLSLLLPHPDFVSERGAAINAALALVAAGIVWALGSKLPLSGFQVLITSGTVLITLGIRFAGYEHGIPTYAFFYLWMVVYCFSFFSLVWAMVQTGIAAAAHLTILALDGEASLLIADWTLTWGVLMVTGFVVGWLSGQVQEMAVTDSLTGLRNRRAWDDELARELVKSARTGHPVSIVLLDVDGLKTVNDTDGHQAGDRLLKEMAASWSSCLRAGDFLARLGGDEFGVLLSACSLEGTHVTVTRLKGATRFPFSAGCAEWDRDELPKDLMHRADVCLYENKRAVTKQASKSTGV